MTDNSMRSLLFEINLIYLCQIASVFQNTRVKRKVTHILINRGEIIYQWWYIGAFNTPRSVTLGNRKCQDYVYMKWEYWSTM